MSTGCFRHSSTQLELQNLDSWYMAAQLELQSLGRPHMGETYNGSFCDKKLSDHRIKKESTLHLVLLQKIFIYVKMTLEASGRKTSRLKMIYRKCLP